MTEQARDEMVAALRSGLDEVEALSSQIPDAAPQGGDWNARDILTHMAFWEARAQEIMRLVPQGQESEMLHPADQAEIDSWNERVRRENQTTSLGLALRYWTDLRRKTIKDLANFAPELLARNYRDRDYTVMEQLAGDTSEHDQEHLAQLRQLAGREDRQEESNGSHA